jgi:hypothetical protein
MEILRPYPVLFSFFISQRLLEFFNSTATGNSGVCPENSDDFALGRTGAAACVLLESTNASFPFFRRRREEARLLPNEMARRVCEWSHALFSKGAFRSQRGFHSRHSRAARVHRAVW